MRSLRPRHALLLGLLGGCGRLGYAHATAPPDAAIDAPFAGSDAPPFDAPAADAPGLDAPATDAGAIDARELDAATDAHSLDAGREDDATIGDAANDARCPVVYLDRDHDGYGEGIAMFVCGPPPPGYAGVTGDCDDLDVSRSPGAEEGCNGRDDDCDMVADEDACAGGPLLAVTTGLSVASTLGAMDVGPTGEVFVLGSRSGGLEVEVLRPGDLARDRGGPAVATGSRAWIRAAPDGGWVVGWGRGVARYHFDGTVDWRRDFTGSGSFTPTGHRVDPDRVVIGGELIGAIDLGAGSMDSMTFLSSLVAEIDTTTGGLSWAIHDMNVTTMDVALLPGTEVGLGGFFALGSGSFAGGPAAPRPLAIVRVDDAPSYRGEWRSSRFPSADEAILGMVRVVDDDVVFSADFTGGTFEGGPGTPGLGGLVARVEVSTGTIRWSRAFSAAFTNQASEAAFGGNLVCFRYELRAAVDFESGVTAAGGPFATCFDVESGATRFGIDGALSVAAGPTGVVYSVERGAGGELRVRSWH